MNTERLLTDLLNLKFDFETNYLKKTVFLNKTLESLFQKNIEENSFKTNLVSNFIIISGFLTSLMFILVSYYKLIHLLVWLSLFSISMVILACSIYSKNKKFRYIAVNMQIFISFLNLSLKLIIISVYYNTQNNDNEMELLRIIIYQSLSTNIYMITKLEANIFISLFYMFFNFTNIIISILFCRKNHYFHLEISVNFCVYLIFYLLRKEWDMKIRHLYAEKYKFETFYLYTFDYINGLNGFTLNINNNLNIFYNDKINNLIKNIIFEKVKKKKFIQKIKIMMIKRI